ncbi:MAG: hypothetical protein AB1772_02820 [Candidatus Zixiibacteriota bacterium]
MSPTFVLEWKSVLRPILVCFALSLQLTRSATADVEHRLSHDQRLSGLDLNRRGQPVLLAAASALAAANGDDFRISLSVSPARFDQNRGRVVQIADRDWWVVWDDDRMGSRKIFCQRYDSLGTPRAGNELLASSSIGADFADPRLALDTLGRIYFSWRDQTGGMIFVSRFAADGSPDWGPVLVSDTSLSGFAGLLDMAVFPDGQIVMVWEGYSALGSTIQMRLYSAAGLSLVGPVQVNTDGGSVNHWAPTVACAPGSGFVVSWEDYRSGQADIYARQYTGAGSAVGSDFALVPPPANTANQYSPRITYSTKDRYVIGWTDHRQGQEIYLQRYNQTTGLVGSNQLISSGLGSVLNRDLHLSASTSGRIHALWSASGADNSIESLMLDSGMAPSGLPAVVNMNALGQRWAPSAAFGRSGHYAVAWTESADDDPDIALMLYEASGNRRLGAELMANDDSQGAHSVSPRILTTTDWWNLVAWVDRRNDEGDIFVRVISHAGDFLGGEARANQDVGRSLQAEPNMAINGDWVLLVWNDARNVGGFSGQHIFGRRMTPHGAFRSGEILFSDSLSLAAKSSPAAALLSDGTGLVAWLDSRSGAPQVYARWLANTGLPEGSDVLLSQPAQDISLTRLAVGNDNTDHIAVAWLDVGAATPSVKVRRFNPDRSDAGSFVYAPTSPGTIEDAAVDIGSDGRVAVFWIGSDLGVRRGFLTMLSSNGSVLGGPIEITDSPQALPLSPAVSLCENQHSSLVWLDQRGGAPKAYFQIVDPALTLIGVNEAASTTTTEFMRDPAVDAFRGRAWFVWSDPRVDGLNVFGRPHVYLPTDVGNDPDGLPREFHLAQNYPNPFNPATEIEYSIPKALPVELSIFNVLGQKIATLIDESVPPGTHRVIWNGTDDHGRAVASGVCFYRLRAGELVASRKMILLK